MRLSVKRTPNCVFSPKIPINLIVPYIQKSVIFIKIIFITHVRYKGGDCWWPGKTEHVWKRTAGKRRRVRNLFKQQIGLEDGYLTLFIYYFYPLSVYFIFYVLQALRRKINLKLSLGKKLWDFKRIREIALYVCIPAKWWEIFVIYGQFDIYALIVPVICPEFLFVTSNMCLILWKYHWKLHSIVIFIFWSLPTTWYVLVWIFFAYFWGNMEKIFPLLVFQCGHNPYIGFTAASSPRWSPILVLNRPNPKLPR